MAANTEYLPVQTESMSERSWKNLIMDDRMTIDQEFAPRIQASPLSQQQWELILVAAEFKVEHPENPEEASIVADTSGFPQITPHLDQLPDWTGQGETTSGVRGFLDTIRGLVDFRREEDIKEETLREGESLAQDYADALESHLRERGKWEKVCEEAVR